MRQKVNIKWIVLYFLRGLLFSENFSFFFSLSLSLSLSLASLTLPHGNFFFGCKLFWRSQVLFVLSHLTFRDERNALPLVKHQPANSRNLNFYRCCCTKLAAKEQFLTFVKLFARLNAETLSCRPGIVQEKGSVKFAIPPVPA